MYNVLFRNVSDHMYIYTYNTAPVWKVARCSSAAPMFFSEFEDHVDGGVLANNPCQVHTVHVHVHDSRRVNMSSKSE